MTEIDKREDYDALLERGIDALCDNRYHIEIHLRYEIQREKFGGNNAVGNAKFYKYCIKHRTMVCEHCGKPINNPSAYNVSHILTRGAHPEMAHDIRNISILCPLCHNNYEHSTTRRKMSFTYLRKIEKIKEQLKQEYGTK